jgi:hypothetical protein
MRNIAILTVLTAALAATVAYATDGDSPKGNDKGAAAAPAPAAAAKAASMTQLKDQKWAPLDPNNAKGPQIAVLFGNPQAAGPFSILLKVPNGFKAGVHSHTNDYTAVVLQGQPSHGDDEKSAKPVSVGGTWSEPGKHSHWDGCVTGKDDCISVVTMPTGPFDFIPADAPKTAAAPAKK